MTKIPQIQEGTNPFAGPTNIQNAAEKAVLKLSLCVFCNFSFTLDGSSDCLCPKKSPFSGLTSHQGVLDCMHPKISTFYMFWKYP